TAFNTANPNNQDSDFRGPPGVRERFEQLTAGGTNYCYLRLPDGGKVKFVASTQTAPSGSVAQASDDGSGSGTGDQPDVPDATKIRYTFSLVAIIDPYGQTTAITHEADGSLTITEPAHRTIKIFYRTITDPAHGAVGDSVIDHILGSDGRT